MGLFLAVFVPRACAGKGADIDAGQMQIARKPVAKCGAGLERLKGDHRATRDNFLMRKGAIVAGSPCVLAGTSLAKHSDSKGAHAFTLNNYQTGNYL